MAAQFGTRTVGLTRTVSCKTVAEFLSAISPQNALYSSSEPRGWIFRGHRDDRWPLVPPSLRSSPHDKRWREMNVRFPNTNREQAAAERFLLKSFMEGADSIGLHIPEDSQALRSLLKLNPVKGALWPPSDILSLMALAQHYGIPTRLLDWSRHPLKAALFAASGASEHESKSGLLSVWALFSEVLVMLQGLPNPFRLITAPSATNPNLRAQEGVFTLSSQTHIDDLPINRASLEDLLSSWQTEQKLTSTSPWLYRITLPQTEADELCLALALEGITQKEIFPDFAGVTKAMEDEIRGYKNPNSPALKRMNAHMSGFIISHEVRCNRFLDHGVV